MGRSKFTEEQALDQDFTTQAELTTVSGYLHHHIKGKFISDNIPSDGAALIYSTATEQWYPATISGGELYSHSDLQDLNADDHWLYVPRDGSRGFTSTVSGIDPTQLYHLTTKNYVDTISGTLQTLIDAKPDTFLDLTDTPSSYVGYRKKLVRVNEESDGLEFVGGEASGDDATFSGIIPHSYLTELDEDQHPALVPRDGSRGFTSTVSGIDPTDLYHLTTKNFVDYEITTTSGYLHDHLKGRYISDIVPEEGMAYVWSTTSNWWYPINVADGFGVGYYYHIDDETEESTNSTSWVDRLILTVSGTEPGEYRLGWYYEYRLNKAGKTLYVRISLDDDYDNLMHDVSLSMIQTTNYVSSAGFYHATLSSGTYHIDVDWKIDSAQGGTTGYLRRVRLEFWRVN